MTDQWGRFEQSASREMDALGWRDNIDVFEPSESYSAGEGYDEAYPSTPTATISGEVQPASADEDVDRGGTTQTADITIYVLTDSGVTWTEAGDSGQAPTRVEIQGEPGTFEVTATEVQHDGFLAVKCDEVDS